MLGPRLDRRIPARRGSQFHRAQRRPTLSRSKPRRITNRSRRRYRPTPRHGRYCDGRIGRRRQPTNPRHHHRTCRARDPLHRISLRRPDDDRRRTQGHRVQRALRRSRDATSHAARRRLRRRPHAVRNRNLQGTTLRWKPEPSVCLVSRRMAIPVRYEPATGLWKSKPWAEQGTFKCSTPARSWVGRASKPQADVSLA